MKPSVESIRPTKTLLLSAVSACFLNLNIVSNKCFAEENLESSLNSESDDSELDINLDDSVFDELEFDETYESHSLTPFKVFLGHQIGVSRLADWDIFNHESWLRIGWSKGLNDWLYAELEAESSALWPSDPIYGGRDEVNTHSEFNLAFLQASLGQWSAKVGKYTIGWGEVEGADVLDILNPRQALTSGEVEDTYGISNGQLFFSLDWYINTNTALSMFYNLQPEFSDGFIEPKTNDNEYGVKLSTRQGHAELGFYAASLLPNIATLNPNFFFDRLSSQESEPVLANPFSLWGFSANYAVGRALLKLDLAYKQNLTYLQNNPPLIINTPRINLIEKNRADIGMGIEYTTATEKQLLLMFVYQDIQDYQGDLVIVGDQALFQQDHITTQLITSFSDTYYNDDLSLDISAISSLDGDLSVIATQLAWVLNDNWRTELNLIKSFTDNTSPLANFDGESLVSARVIYQF